MTATISTSTLEERVTLLEQELANLKHQNAATYPAAACGWKGFVGVYKDDPEFEEAARFGREYREAQAPGRHRRSRRLMYVLDTDMLSLLERDNAESTTLQTRLRHVPLSDVVTTVITYEEQMRGWLSRIAQANTPAKILTAYARLQTHLNIFNGIAVLPFDAPALAEYERRRQERVRIGTMDLKIAAITLANNAILLTRNTGDFARVSGLRYEDWSV